MADKPLKSETALREPSSAKATEEQGRKSETALREENVLEFWNKNDIFKKSLEKDAPKGDYVFYDGPPFATGLPHYGHIVASVIKDVVPRYWTMRGYHVPRVWGWDCHGLPIENIVEKELGFKHKKDITKMGVAKFNEMCRARVLTYASEWEKIIPRIGRWADMKHAYRTMDKPFMESVWWVFKQIYDKGLVYEDYRSMHICPRCETTLSQQEVSEGYDEVKDVSMYIKFELKDEPQTFFLVWTTTPWTLPGNAALAINSSFDYVKIKYSGPPLSERTSFSTGHQEEEKTVITPGTYILEKDIFWRNAQLGPGLGEIVKALLDLPSEDLLSDSIEYQSNLDGFIEKHKSKISIVKGGDLLGKSYIPPFDYYSSDTSLKHHEKGWRVYDAGFVNREEGTGVVHIAPAFGTDDWELSKKENLPFIQHVNMDGTFKSEVKAFSGKDLSPRAKGKKNEIREIDFEIKNYLVGKKLLVHWDKYPHQYPHCWRCDTPLLNYATSSWFVSVTKLKENLIKTAENINWSPAHIKEGRFGDWLMGARDWSISRQRFWASVIPIWKCVDCKKLRVFGSAAELEEASGKKIDDLHKHIVDEITVPCECGETMSRIPDVLDTWFDSGSMPYGERHYPFAFSTDSKGATLDPLKVAPWSRTFPAQFIAEGLDQTRAWFYYLHVLSGAIFNKSAFQNVIVNGIVLAEDGKKMSKKLQNYPDPVEVLNKYGADALRLYLLSSPVVQAENLSFSENGVDEVAKKNIGRLNNVLAFYKLYENQTLRDFKSTNILDQWIIARLAALIGETTEGYEKYQLDKAVRPLVLFIDDLSVWYVRRSRDRISAKGRSASGGKEDTKAALATLRYVLHTLSRIIAPSMPFLAEHIFQAVREGEDEESVHLTAWPEIPKLEYDAPAVLAVMMAARGFVTMAHMQRSEAGIKVRQPLTRLSIKHNMGEIPFWNDVVPLIADETNVKEVMLSNRMDQDGPGVLLDIELTAELKEEGFVRELVRAIQDARKNAGLNPRDSALLTISAPDASGIIERNVEAIKQATTVSEIVFGETYAEAEDIGGYRISLLLQATGY